MLISRLGLVGNYFQMKLALDFFESNQQASQLSVDTHIQQQRTMKLFLDTMLTKTEVHVFERGERTTMEILVLNFAPFDSIFVLLLLFFGLLIQLDTIWYI